MSAWEAVLLGVVQGLTEFLPVSSSGQLILARAFFGWDPGRFGIAFDVACHVGTLLAVVAFFATDVGRLIAAAPGALSGKDGEYKRLGRLIIAGTIPVVIVGGLFAGLIETRFRSPLIVASSRRSRSIWNGPNVAVVLRRAVSRFMPGETSWKSCSSSVRRFHSCAARSCWKACCTAGSEGCWR